MLVPFGKSPVTVQIKVNCGCGFKTDNLDSATIHVTTTGHIMHVLGMISKG